MSGQEYENTADITLNMECFEDELSPSQINAYKAANEKFNRKSRLLSSIIDEIDILYENSIVMVICVPNNTSESHQNDHVNSKTPNREVFNSVATNTENLQLFDTIASQSNSVVSRKLQFSNATDKLSSTKLPTKLIFGPLISNTDSYRKKNGTTYGKSSNVLVINNKNGKTILNKTKLHPTLLVETKPNEILVSVRKTMKDEEQLWLYNKIKLILSYKLERLIEWISNQGLIRSEQYCEIHRKTQRSRLRLKYLETRRLLSSGRYVWVSNCCPHKYISIFRGTLFADAQYAPISLVKLLYHWSCQTDLLSTLESVKISKVYLRSIYTNLRSVCLAAIHEDCKELLGGNNKMVEVGLISMGIESDKKQIQIKACILGVLDSDTKRIRMHVLGKGQNNFLLNYKLFHFLTKIVNKNSIILTDLHLKKHFFTAIGFKNVYQRPIIDQRKKKVYSNENIMMYLKNCMPRVFRNSLSFLSRPFIQLCLDELCWREKWGVTSLRAFNSIIDHIRKQTNLCPNVALSYQLSKITCYPFMDWQYSKWKSNLDNIKTKKVGIKNINKMQADFHDRNKIQDAFYSGLDQIHNTPPAIKRITHHQAEQKADAKMANLNGLQKLYFANYKPVHAKFVNLESYYYGIISGNKDLLMLESKITLNIECFCGVNLKTNIGLMRHIVSHAFSYINSVNDNLHCKYCLKSSSNLIHSNLIQNSFSDQILNCVKHNKSEKPNYTTCLICEQDLKFRTKLVLHMHFLHDELEMPYECGVCRFRSSQHRITVDHFYETHYNGKKGQCPLCLKVVAFIDNNGFIIIRNIYFFLNHIRRHNYEYLIRKCDKCVLTFVNEGVLNYHKKNHHNSCKDLSNIQRYIPGKVTMPIPVTSNSGINTNNNIELVDLLKKCTYKKFNIIKKVEAIHINAECCECEGYIMEDSHLIGEFSCSLCQFKTCCDKSMFEHSLKFHSLNFALNLTENRKIKLNDHMYCICGFKSFSGNKLASHLINCGKITAYSKVIK